MSNSREMQWHDHVQKDLNERQEILLLNDLFEDWNRSRMPEGLAAEEFYLGLEALYGRENTMGRSFLTRCVAIADRAFDEIKFEHPRCRGGFPANRGKAERLRVYAAALLGKKVKLTRLIPAAEDILSWWRREGEVHDDQRQALWLAAARMQLIAGDPQTALASLEEATSLKTHQTEADILAGIARAAVEKSAPIVNAKLLGQTEKLFDRIRSPKWRGSPNVYHEPDEQRLEIAVIRHLYFYSKGSGVDWDYVIDSILE